MRYRPLCPAVQESITASTSERSEPVFVPSQVFLRDYTGQEADKSSTSAVLVKDIEYALNNHVEGNKSDDLVVDENVALDAVRSDLRNAGSWSMESLMSCQSTDTVILPDHSPLFGKLSNGESVLLLGDQLLNKEAKFVGKLRPPGRKEVLKANLALVTELRLNAYVNPKSAKPPVKKCPYGQQTSGGGRSQADSGRGGSYQGSVVTGYGGLSFRSGLGCSGGGDRDEDDDDDPWKQRPIRIMPSHYTDADFAHVYVEEQPAGLGRRVPLQPFVAHGQVATNYDPGLLAIPPQLSYTDLLPQYDHILSSATPPPTQPLSVAVTCLEAVDFPQEIDMVIGSPPPTQHVASANNCLGPSTMPQGTTANERFTFTTKIEAGECVCEIAVKRALPQQVEEEALEYLSKCNDLYTQLVSCLEQPCGLRIAVEARAKLFESTFSRAEGKMVFKMPSGMRLEEWVIKRPSIDLCERGYVLVQVVNTLAAIHMLGHRDCLSLSGFFIAWVTPEMQVYLLVDITKLFSIMQVHAADYGMSLRKKLRSEDANVVRTLYHEMIGQHIDHDNQWFSLDPFHEFSPAVLKMFQDFKAILVDESCWSKMADLAMTLGQRSMCKLEVEGSRAPFPVYVSCLEQEPMSSALSALSKLVKKDVSLFWMVRWKHSCETVCLSDHAVAYRRMQLELIPTMYNCSGDRLCIHASD